MKLTKQQENCEYCHGDRDAKPLSNLSDSFLAFDRNGCVLASIDGYTHIWGADTFLYCPQCGRPLNEEEE